MTTTLDAVRAAALFACDLQPDEHPGPAQVRRAVTAVLHRHGAHWCTARVAEEFAADPRAAARRMAWVLRVVTDCYAAARPVSPTRCRTRCGPPVRLLASPGAGPRCPVGHRRRPVR